MLVYDAAAFGAGARLKGPAVLEMPTTTILLLDQQEGQIDRHGNLLVELKSGLDARRGAGSSKVSLPD